MAAQPLKIGYLMDPLPGIDIDKDSTFVLMLEAQRRGHEIFYAAAADLAVRSGTTEARLWPVEVRRSRGDHFTLGEPRRRPLAELDVLFLRKDPPFDMAFFFDTQLVSLAGAGPLFVNDPRGLREANEKLYALRFPEIVPESLVTSDPWLLRQFMADLGGEMIIKPLDGCGGAGVFHLREGDRNLNAILETTTAGGRRLMAQRYVPEVRRGDKRIILINGEPRGGVLRVPSENESRSNFHVGGSALKTELTTRDLEICARIAPDLVRDGLIFVGIDVIGDWLTEINVTSPTGIQEINALDGVCLEAEMIDWVERQASRLPPAASALADQGR